MFHVHRLLRSLFLLLALLGAAPLAHAAMFTVTKTADTIDGTYDSDYSLREAITAANAVNLPDTVTFDRALSGATITLTSGEIVLTSDVTIDASSLPGGVTVSGGGTSRIFRMSSGQTVALQNLTLTGGNGIGGGPNLGYGGAISNIGGTVTLTRCTLFGNSANSVTSNGGAIYTNAGSLTLRHCTLSGNSANSDGAIKNDGPLTLTHCTLSGNSANNYAGAIGTFATLTLTNSIVAGNTAGFGGADIYIFGGSVTASGANFVGDVSDSGLTASTTLLTTAQNGAIQLAPLASNGGPTQTMALLSGSPALDAAVGSSETLDQRGFARNRDGDGNGSAVPDLGAYEAQVMPFSLGFNFNGDSPRNLLPGEYAGAPEFLQNNWNNLTSDFGISSGAFTTSGGSSVNLRAWYDAPGTWAVNFATPGTAHQKLMWGYLDSDGTANSGTNLYNGNNQPFLAIADLPAAFTQGGYKVVVYADSDASDGRVGEYWLTSHADPADVSGTSEISSHLFLADSGNFSGTYIRSTSTSRSGAAAGNYLVFENQTQPGFILRTEDNPSLRAVINAVQIVRNESIVVTTAADELDANGTLGTGVSLREAVRDAPDGATILFDASLSGATITLGSAVVIGKNLTIDAGSLPGGVTLNGNDTNEIFDVNSGATVTRAKLTLTGEYTDYDGGAIFNAGTLTLVGCTLTDNHIGFLGSFGGGAIVNYFGTLTMTQCNLSGNSASGGYGGAISNYYGTLTLNNSIVAGNSALVGGISSTGTLTLNNSIVAGNTGNIDDAFSGSNNITSGTATAAGLEVDGSGIPVLKDNGGPTKTIALLPASLAINAATGSTITSDQRGFPTIGTPDIGAFEYVPLFTIADKTVNEGDSGTINATFTVTLAPVSAQTVTVNYATANGTATAGSDYTTTSGTLTFSPGQTSKTFNVPIIGNTTVESTETFLVNLSNATNAGILDAQAVGTIIDDDATPQISVNDVTVTEGNTGTTNANFTVSLSSPSGKT